MLKQVHQHITSELQQSARTDTIFVVTAIVFNLWNASALASTG